MLMGSILNIYNSNLLVHCSGNIFFRELIEHSVMYKVRRGSGSPLSRHTGRHCVSGEGQTFMFPSGCHES